MLESKKNCAPKFLRRWSRGARSSNLCETRVTSRTHGGSWRARVGSWGAAAGRGGRARSRSKVECRRRSACLSLRRTSAAKTTTAPPVVLQRLPETFTIAPPRRLRESAAGVVAVKREEGGRPSTLDNIDDADDHRLQQNKNKRHSPDERIFSMSAALGEALPPS